MSSIRRCLALIAPLPVILAAFAGPAAATDYPAPSHSVSKTCTDNQTTVVEISLAGYPEGSVASIEGDLLPMNSTTTVFITRPIVLEVDSSGTNGDVSKRIWPKPLCRLHR